MARPRRFPGGHVDPTPATTRTTPEQRSAVIDRMLAPYKGRRIRPALPSQEQYVREAIYELRDAREHLKLAGCPQALAKVKRALKSAEGALRHIGHRVRRSQDGGI